MLKRGISEGGARTIVANLTDDELERAVTTLQAKRDAGEEMTPTCAYGLWLFTQERAERKAIAVALKEAGVEAVS